MTHRPTMRVAGVQITAAWIQWLISMAVGAAVVYSMMNSRLTALETDVQSFKTQLPEIRNDVREIRTYLLGKKKGE